MHGQRLVRGVHPVHAGQRRMQAKEAAKVQQSIGLAGHRRHDLASQPDQPAIAIRDHRRHAIERAAQDNHDQSLLGGGRGHGQGGAANTDAGCQAKQRAAARQVHWINASGIRDWSAAASSRRGVSPLV